MVELMAVELPVGHGLTCRDDLKPFFWVLIWQRTRRGWERVGNSKAIQKDSLRPVIQKVVEGLRPFCQRLSHICSHWTTARLG